MFSIGRAKDPGDQLCNCMCDGLSKVGQSEKAPGDGLHACCAVIAFIALAIIVVVALILHHYKVI